MWICDEAPIPVRERNMGLQLCNGTVLFKEALFNTLCVFARDAMLPQMEMA